MTSSYDYDDGKKLQPGIVGLFPGADGKIRYLYKQENEVDLCNEKGAVLVTFPVPDAETFVASAVCDEEAGVLYYLTRDGKIMKQGASGGAALLFSATSVDKRTSPYEISLSPVGILYVTDLVRRIVFSIDPETGETEELAEEGKALDREIVYSVCAHRGIVGASHYAVKIFTRKGVMSRDTFFPAEQMKLYVVLLWAAAVYVVLFLIGLSVWFVYLFYSSASAFARLVTILFLGVVLLCGLLTGILIPQFQNMLPDEVYKRANLAADVTAQKIHLDDLLSLDSVEDYHSKEYMSLKRTVDRVFRADAEDEADLYCTFYRVIDDTVTTVFSNNDVSVCYPYDQDYAGSDEERILSTGEGKRYQSHSSEGSYVYVLNPIFNEAGEPVALLEVGTDLGSVNETIEKTLVKLGENVTVMFLVVILGMYVVHIRRKKKEAGRFEEA